MKEKYLLPETQSKYGELFLILSKLGNSTSKLNQFCAFRVKLKC